MHALWRLIAGLACLSGAWASAEQAPIVQHGGKNVSTALFVELEELARVVDIAYCVGMTGVGITKPFQCLSRCSGFPKFELVTTWNTGPLLSDSCGYIALDHGKERVIVAFRGTYSITNTIVDLSTNPQKYEPYPGSGEGDEPKCHNCTVHAGFQKSWENTRDAIIDELERAVQLHPTYQLHLVGHSLGGAVAALGGLDMIARGWDPILTTFGEPRIGNAKLVRYINSRFKLVNSSDEDGLRYRRLTHVDDPVPLLPLTEWGYDMHAGEIYISKPSLSPGPGDLQHCKGNNDPKCIAAQDASISVTNDGLKKRDLLGSVKDELHDVVNEPWGIPSRYKLWQLFFAHRDYFWRLGLCVPGGDPLGGGVGYEGLGGKLDL